MRHLDNGRNNFKSKSDFEINKIELLEQYFNEDLEIDLEIKIEEKLLEDDNYLDKYLEIVESSDEMKSNSLSDNFTDNLMDIIKSHNNDEVKFNEDNHVNKEYISYKDKNFHREVKFNEKTNYNYEKRKVQSIFAKKKASNLQVYDNNKEIENIVNDKKVITYEEIQETIRKNKRVNKIIYYTSVACIGALFMATGIVNNMFKSVYELDNSNTTKAYLNIRSGWSDRLTSETSRIIQSLVK